MNPAPTIPPGEPEVATLRVANVPIHLLTAGVTSGGLMPSAKQKNPTPARSAEMG